MHKLDKYLDTHHCLFIDTDMWCQVFLDFKRNENVYREHRKYKPWFDYFHQKYVPFQMDIILNKKL